MEIDSDEEEAHNNKGTNISFLVVHPSYYQEEPVDLLRDVEVTKKRLAWLRDTLQDAYRHATPSGTLREIK
jgi:hypothetical protein